MIKLRLSIKRFMLALFVVGAVAFIATGCTPKTVVVPVDSVTISTAGNSTEINTIGGTLQFSAVVLPDDSGDRAVVWSVQNGTGSATISQNGLLTAVANGTVTVKATSVSDSTKLGSMVITLSNQDIVPNSISVSSENDRAFINVYHSTLQMSALVLPDGAVNKNVSWSVENGTGSATITNSGLLTAVSNGTIVVKAMSVAVNSVFGTKTITLSNQDDSVASVEISTVGNVVLINTFQGTLQLSGEVLPVIAMDKSIIWSVVNGTGSATISNSGLLTAESNGLVMVHATSVSNPSVHDTVEITLSNQEVVVTSIELISAENAEIINTFGGTLQFSANVLPADAFDKAVIWGITNGSGEATISNTGLVSAVANGTVTVVVTSVSNSEVNSMMVITISNQEVLVNSISINGADSKDVIDVNDGTLQMEAIVLPANAEDMSVIWSVVNGTGEATIDENGLLTAVSNGTVTVYSTSFSNEIVVASKIITISNQEEVVELEAPVNLLTAGDFTILSKTGISTAADSLIVGNIGVSPAAATYITGFSLSSDGSTEYATSTQVVGMVYASDFSSPTAAYLTQAISDMEAAYTDAASRAPDFTELYAGDLSGQTLVSGVYKYGTDVVIYSNVILSGGAEDVWIFQISGNVTQAVSVQIILQGGALAENVFWQVAGDVSIETSAHFVGTVLSMTKITLGTNATVSGKLLSQTAVTLDANIVSPIEVVVPSSLSVTSDQDATEINVFGGSLQMFVEFSPIDTTNQAVLWSVENITGQAVISETGLLEALENGLVTVKVTSAENSLIFDTFEVTISHQEVLVESIAVAGDNDELVIDVMDGTLQMNANVMPVDADNQQYTWSVENGTGEATINPIGMLTAVSDGTVIVKATLNADPLIFGSVEITISNQTEAVVNNSVDLLSAEDFTILTKTGISATVGTHVTGNLGVSPGPASYITGFSLVLDPSNEFSTSSLVTGNIYGSDYAALTPSYLSTAISDMETAYTDAASRTPDFTELYAGDISGQTLVAGVYYWSSGLLINTDVILSGDASQVWIFQIAGTLGLGVDVNIILEGGALAENVIWQVASAASIGVGAHFEGTILGMTSVILGTGATFNGKIYAQTAVTLDANTVN